MFIFNSELTKARLLVRYKRFLADVVLENGEQITVHCPNTGAMTGCQKKGALVYLSRSSNPKRKYLYTWEYYVDKAGKLVCVNTSNANRVIAGALKQKIIPEFAQYDKITSEQRVLDSRIDFMLTDASQQTCYLEVKSVTLAKQSTAYFPDTQTKRGLKHCNDLAMLSQQGYSANLLFCVVREGIEQFKIAEHIDPNYAQAVRDAINKGVNVLCYACQLSQSGIALTKKISIIK